MALLEQFENLSLDIIRGYISSQQEENLSLDFKLINRVDFSHRDDRKTLATAISGFANSNGGLVIWGGDARKNEQGIDCASGIREIEPLPLFIARINELTGSATNPIVDGVRHKPIFTTDSRGLAVTLVPESDSGPYMAKLGEDRYFKRSGDSFYRMEHFDLEDMFGRRRKAQLRLLARVSRARDEIVIGIINEGRGTAKAPYLSFHVPEPFTLSLYGVDGNGSEGLPRLQHGGNTSSSPRYGANSNIVIHPNTILDVTRIDYRGREEGRPNGRVEIAYQIAAEGMQLVEARITVDVNEQSMIYKL